MTKAELLHLADLDAHVRELAECVLYAYAMGQITYFEADQELTHLELDPRLRRQLLVPTPPTTN